VSLKIVLMELKALSHTGRIGQVATLSQQVFVGEAVHKSELLIQVERSTSQRLISMRSFGKHGARP